MEYKARVSKDKKEVVAKMEKLFTQYPIVAAMDLENLPTAQLQNMRAQLRKKDIVLLMTKRRIMKIAIDGAQEKKKDIGKIKEHLKGMPALLFTKENPFTLYKMLKKSKSPAPAKAGQIAPNNIIIPAGPTPFAPGPIISELASVGIKSGVENGKVAVKEDKVVVKAGEEIKQKVAELLGRLGIKPMEIGLNLVAAYENGDILTRDILDIDEEKYLSDISIAARQSFNLAVFACVMTKETSETIIQKAYNDAKGLATSEGIAAVGLMPEIIGRANLQALALKTELNV